MKYSFQQFLKNQFPWFVIDEACETIIQFMDWWANRDERFEKRIPKEFVIHRQVKDAAEGPMFASERTVDAQSRLFLDKGFCIIGPVGSGKTVLLELLNHYLHYLKSPYCFAVSTIPEISATIRLNEDQESIMRRYCDSGNRMFDELAKEDQFGVLREEEINLFGNKCLLGDSILHRRHILFTRTGYLTHFTTNHTLTSLGILYGERFISRLLYFCNVFTYIGDDRRPNARPVFLNNKNIDYSHLNVVQEEWEHQEGIKNILEEKYQSFIKGKLNLNSITFQQFQMVGVQVADEENWKKFFSEALQRRKEELSLPRQSQGEAAQRKRILEMYATGNLSDAENAKLKDIARTIAVRSYFNECKKQGKEKLFA